MSIPQWFLTIMIGLDIFGFLVRQRATGSLNKEPLVVIVALCLRYGMLLAVLKWGGWYG